MKTNFKILAGMIFSILAISALVQGDFFPFLLFVIGAFLTFPALYRKVKDLIGFDIDRPFKYIFTLVCLFLGVNLIDNKKVDKQPETTERITVRDTIYIHDTVYIDKKQKGQTSQRTSDLSNNLQSSSLQSETVVSKTVSKPKKQRSSYSSSSSSGYTRGPRGGCYYINSSGRKVYVDRSLCD